MHLMVLKCGVDSVEAIWTRRKNNILTSFEMEKISIAETTAAFIADSFTQSKRSKT